MREIYDGLWRVFIIITFLFPQTLPWLRLGLMLLISIVSVALEPRIRINRGRSLLLLFVSCNALFILRGIMLNGSVGGALRLDILWPLLFFVMINAWDENTKVNVLRMMLYAGIGLCMIHTIWLLTAALGIQMPGFIKSIQESDSFMFNRIGFFYQYYASSQSTLVFVIPYIFIVYLKAKRNFNRLFINIGLTCAAICFVFSGRIGFYISIPLSFIMGLFFSSNSKAERKKTIIYLCIFVIIVLLVIRFSGTRIEALIDYAFVKFNSLTANDNNVRALQTKYLIEGWMQSPILGQGVGRSLGNIGGINWSERGIEETYLVLLFQKGIIGLALNLMFYGWIVINLIKNARNNSLLSGFYYALLSGMVSILIANASNPYMQTVGCLWMIYIPLGAVLSKKYNSEEINYIRLVMRGK